MSCLRKLTSTVSCDIMHAPQKQRFKIVVLHSVGTWFHVSVFLDGVPLCLSDRLLTCDSVAGDGKIDLPEFMVMMTAIFSMVWL